MFVLYVYCVGSRLANWVTVPRDRLRLGLGRTDQWLGLGWGHTDLWLGFGWVSSSVGSG